MEWTSFQVRNFHSVRVRFRFLLNSCKLISLAREYGHWTCSLTRAACNSGRTNDLGALHSPFFFFLVLGLHPSIGRVFNDRNNIGILIARTRTPKNLSPGVFRAKALSKQWMGYRMLYEPRSVDPFISEKSYNGC